MCLFWESTRERFRVNGSIETVLNFSANFLLHALCCLADERSFCPFVAMPLNHLRRRLLDRMVLRPSRHPIESALQKRVALTVRGRLLECFVQQHPSADDRGRVLVIKFPGTSGRAEQSTGLPLTLLHGVAGTTWTWNPPGYGGSQGRASLPIIAEAAVEFVQQVIDREADAKTTIWLAGNSIGCATALNVAAATHLDPNRTGIVLRNPPPIPEVVKHVASRYPLGSMLNRLADRVHRPMNALFTASQVQLPAVFLQSGADRLVPPALQNKVIAEYAGKHQVVVMDDLDHDDLTNEHHDQRIRDSLHWLLDQTGYRSDSGCNADHNEQTKKS